MPDLPVPESKIRFLINSCMIHKTIEITFPFKAIFIKNNAAATVAKDMKKITILTKDSEIGRLPRLNSR